MNKPHYFTLRFHGFAVGNDPESSFLRLVTRHHTFYTDKRFFQDEAGFDQLQKESLLHLGTHRLKDGSYWIDWLTDGTTTLETAGARPSLRLPLGRLLTGVPAFFISGSMMFSWGFAFLMPLLFLAVTMMLLTWGLSDVHAVCLRFSPRVRDLQARLEQAKRGDTAFCEDIGPALLNPPYPDAMPEGFSDFGPQLSEIKHTVSAVRSGEWKSYVADSSGAALVYVCQGRGLSLSWRMGDPALRSQLDKILPFFYRTHAPFISQGDHVLTIFNHHSNKAIGVYNFTDGGCYIANGNWYRSDQSMAAFYRGVLFIFAPGLMALMLLFGAGFALSAGNVWRWHSVCGALKIMVSVICTFCGALLGGSDLAIQLTRLLSSRVGHWLRLRRRLEQLRQEQQRTPWIQEIW
ncbi:hypothetical protein [Phytobacter massiliensis]|uniref:hypothetical protein n=1 Tax=Phytobacter massiliensis TaxID=1485952 RepID=UPI0002F125BA|nr:hypothetical protein [Phytobacter massiliensis]